MQKERKARKRTKPTIGQAPQRDTAEWLKRYEQYATLYGRYTPVMLTDEDLAKARAYENMAEETDNTAGGFVVHYNDDFYVIHSDATLEPFPAFTDRIVGVEEYTPKKMPTSGKWAFFGKNYVALVPEDYVAGTHIDLDPDFVMTPREAAFHLNTMQEYGELVRQPDIDMLALLQSPAAAVLYS